MNFDLLVEIGLTAVSAIIIVYILCYAVLSAIEAIIEMFGGN